MRRLAAGRDDAGTAMLLVVMCLLISMTLSTALLGVITGELRPTAFQGRSARSAQAAEAGLQVGVNLVRAASATVTGIGQVGDLSKLPCNGVSAPLAASVATGGGGAAYSVRLRYFTLDPSGQSATWRTSNAIPCTTGAGPTTAPLYVLIESSGTAPSTGGLGATTGTRAMELVYGMRTSDQGTLGGQIHLGSSPVDYCWSAPAAVPAAGTRPVLGACSTGGPAQQWAYRNDYSLVIAGTQASNGTGGMCLSDDQVGFLNLMSLTDTLASDSDVSLGNAGPVNSTAATFNGAGKLDSTVQLSSPGPAAATVSAWIRTTATTGGTIFSYTSTLDTSPGQYDRQLYMDPAGHLVFGVWNTIAYAAISPATYNDGAWHHVAGSYGSTGVRLVVDGGLVASNYGTKTAEAASGYWHVGWGPASGSWPNKPTTGYWNGSLAHAAIWHTQLSDASIRVLAAQTSDSALRTAIEALNPRSYWPFSALYSDFDLTFQTCDAANHQKFAYNDSGRFEALLLDGSALSNRCVQNESTTASAQLDIAPTCASTPSVSPDYAVGAGAAGTLTQQLINYAEYGRCLDVTWQQITVSFLIAFPCKQDPSRLVTWNQRFVWDSVVTHELQTNPYGTQYCLIDPGAVGGNVVAQVCDPSRSDERWTMYGDTGNRTTAYTIVSNAGRCLDLGAPQGGLSWSSIVMATCTGALSQKWNAPPQVWGGSVGDQRDTTGDR